MNPDHPDHPDNPGGVNNPKRTRQESRIKDALDRVLNGEIAVFDEEPGYCLRVARQIVSAGLGLSGDEFYRRYRRVAVDDNPDPVANVWARDVQRSLRELGYRVAYDETSPLILRDLEPGDLIFSWALGAPIGHVAVVLTSGQNALAYENTHQDRGVRHSGFNRLTRVDELMLLYPGSWEAYRIPEDTMAEKNDINPEVDPPIIDPPPIPDPLPDAPPLPDLPDTGTVSLEPPKLDLLKPFKRSGDPPSR